MSDFKAEMHQISFPLSQTPLGKLTAFPQTLWLYLRGLPVREREGRQLVDSSAI